LWVCDIDAAQLQTALLNLALNARDAMPNGGILTIETHGSARRPTPVSAEPYATPSWYSMITVTDTGVGMDERTKARVFEPFFTTKEPGKGTGLGLATVYGIVRQYDGVVRFDTEVGRGTSFKIYLPQTDQPTESSEPRDGALAPGSETILIAEDAPAVRTAARLVLERVGYKVLEASEAPTALYLAARHAGPIDLLLTETTMPGVSGRQLADEFLALRGNARVLFISASDAPPAEETTTTPPEHSGYLQKPFTSLALARKVRELLDAAPAS
jgi:CheY-like chemotaxis protein